MNVPLTIRLTWYRIKDDVPHFISRHLPRKLVMWCYIRIGAHATTGKFGNTNPNELGMMDALKRWDEEN